jgi:hypothetical protein
VSQIIRKLGVLRGVTPLNEPSDYEINCIKEINDEDFQRFKTALYELRQFEADQQLLLICILNLQELVKFANNFYSRWQEKQLPSDFRMESLSPELNRLILNFLSSVRTYLDHTATRLSRRFGKDSAELAEFKLVCSQQYDSCFEFRFMSELRNHAQHSALPIQNINLISNLDEESGEVVYSLRILFNRDSLLQDKKIKASLRKEIAELEAELDIKPFVENTIQSVYNIENYVVKKYSNNAIESARYMLEFIDPLSEVTGSPTVVEYDLDGMVEREKPPPLTLYNIPRHIALDIMRIAD